MQREITQEMAKDRLPRREADANKGSFGSVLVAAGSMAYRGAAGDRCAKRLGMAAMLPHDIFADLGAIFAELER